MMLDGSSEKGEESLVSEKSQTSLGDRKDSYSDSWQSERKPVTI